MSQGKQYWISDARHALLCCLSSCAAARRENQRFGSPELPLPSLMATQRVIVYFPFPLRRFCEDQFLAVAVRHGLCRPPSLRQGLPDLLKSHLDKVQCCLDTEILGACQCLAWEAISGNGRRAPRASVGGVPMPGAPLAAWHLQIPLVSPHEASNIAHILMRGFLTRRLFALSDVLWRVGDPSEALYIIERGAVRVRILNCRRRCRQLDFQLPPPLPLRCPGCCCISGSLGAAAVLP